MKVRVAGIAVIKWNKMPFYINFTAALFDWIALQMAHHESCWIIKNLLEQTAFDATGIRKSGSVILQHNPLCTLYEWLRHSHLMLKAASTEMAGACMKKIDYFALNILTPFKLPRGKGPTMTLTDRGREEGKNQGNINLKFSHTSSFSKKSFSKLWRLWQQTLLLRVLFWLELGVWSLYKCENYLVFLPRPSTWFRVTTSSISVDSSNKFTV